MIEVRVVVILFKSVVKIEIRLLIMRIGFVEIWKLLVFRIVIFGRYCLFSVVMSKGNVRFSMVFIEKIGLLILRDVKIMFMVLIDVL